MSGPFLLNATSRLGPDSPFANTLQGALHESRRHDYIHTEQQTIEIHSRLLLILQSVVALVICIHVSTTTNRITLFANTTQTLPEPILTPQSTVGDLKDPIIP
jgi:hypothetical protein